MYLYVLLVPRRMRLYKGAETSLVLFPMIFLCNACLHVELGSLWLIIEGFILEL